MLESFVVRLNQRPALISLCAGLLIYACAFMAAFIGVLVEKFLLGEFLFLMSGLMIVSYHWVISRFVLASVVAQFIQLFFAVILVSIVMVLVSAVLHNKSYEVINGWLF